MTKELPVINKMLANNRIKLILYGEVVVCMFILFLTNSIGVFYYFSAIFIISLCFVIPHMMKHDIKRVFIDSDFLIIYHRKEKLMIPVNDIQSITNETTYYSHISAELSNTYTLHIKNRYSFGKKLVLKYKYSGKNNIETKPEEIIFLMEKSGIKD